jgi:hypothetical protein
VPASIGCWLHHKEGRGISTVRLAQETRFTFNVFCWEGMYVIAYAAFRPLRITYAPVCSLPVAVVVPVPVVPVACVACEPYHIGVVTHVQQQQACHVHLLPDGCCCTCCGACRLWLPHFLIIWNGRNGRGLGEHLYAVSCSMLDSTCVDGQILVVCPATARVAAPGDRDK